MTSFPLQSNGNPDPKLYVWDVELDTVQYFNLESGRGEQDEYMATTQGGEIEDYSDADKWVTVPCRDCIWQIMG